MKVRVNYPQLSALSARAGMLSRWLVSVMLSVGSQMSVGVCVAVERPDFTAFMKMHEAHCNAVRTGMVRMRYTEFEYVPNAAQQREAERAEAIRWIQEDSNFSPEMKEQAIATIIENPEPKYSLASERTLDIYRDFIFDLSNWRFKQDEKPVDPNFFERWGVDFDRVVLTLDDGTQIRYSRSVDSAVIHENAIDNLEVMADALGAFLGVIRPARLRGAPNNVAVFAEKLDGQEVVVYEISDSGGRDVLRIWADPSVGYRYRQVEFVRDGKVVERITAKDYKFFDGVAFPTFYEDTTYRVDPNHPIRRRETFRVFEARFNRELDPNAFRLRFTPSTTCFGPSRMFKPCPDNDCELTVEELLEQAQDLDRASKGTSVSTRPGQ